MSKWLVALSILLAVSEARAECGIGGPCGRLELNMDFNFGPLFAAVAIGSVDVMLTGVDIKRAIAGPGSSRLYGVAETVVAAPQLVFAGTLISDGEGDALVWAYTAWMGALTIHGLYSLAVGDAPEQRAVRVVPTATASSGGLAAVGTF